MAVRFTHAETLNDPVVSTTGPRVVIFCPACPVSFAPLPVQVTPDAVARFPVPEESVTVVPEDWVSGHQPAGPPAPGSATVWDVLLPIGS